MTITLLGRERAELKIGFILITVFLAAILIYPLYSVLIQSFFVDGAFSLSNFSRYLTDSRFFAVLGNSFKASFTVAAIATTLAFFCAYGLNFCRYRDSVKQGISMVILLPLFLPSITYGFAIIYSFGRQGLITKLFGQLPFSIYGFNGLVIAGVIYTLPPAFMILNNAFKYVDRNFVIVSKVMGDSALRSFYMTGLRPVMGAMISAFILCFFLNFTDFGIPASIGGRYEVIATKLYAVMMGAVPDFANGSVIAISMLVPSIVSVLILSWSDRLNFRYNKISPTPPQPNRIRDWAFMAYFAAVALLILSTFAVMFVVPFVKSYPYQLWFTTDTITRILSDGAVFGAYKNSLYVAVLSAALGTVICYFAGLINARSNLNGFAKTTLDAFAMIANTVPGMVLGIGFLFAFTGTSLMNTFAILVLANVVHFFTTPYFMAKQAFSRMNRSYEVTGALMGDSWFKTLRRVVVPNSYSTIIEMFSYIFINAMVTISAIVFLTGARTMVTTAKIKELQHFEKFDAIFVLSILIFATNVAAKLLLDRFARRLSVKNKTSSQGN